jgi:hypothetical protein
MLEKSFSAWLTLLMTTKIESGKADIANGKFLGGCNHVQKVFNRKSHSTVVPDTYWDGEWAGGQQHDHSTSSRLALTLQQQMYSHHG